MTTSPAQPARGSWYQRTFTTGRPYAPLGVRTVTTLFIILGILYLVGSLLRIVVAAPGVSEGGWRLTLLIASVIGFVFWGVLLWLSYMTRKGALWAWITLLVLLGIPLLVGLVLGVMEVLDGQLPVVGLGMVVVPGLLMLLLAGGRKSREYFLRPEEYARRWHSAA